MYFIFNSMLLPGICSPLCSRYLKHCTFAQEASLSSEVKGIEVCFLAHSLPRCQQQVFGHVGNGIAINQFVPSDWERGTRGWGVTHVFLVACATPGAADVHGCSHTGMLWLLE